MRRRTRFDRRGADVKRRVRNVPEAAFAAFAAVLVAAAFLGLMWLYCAATPDQCSAECDWQRAEMEAAR